MKKSSKNLERQQLYDDLFLFLYYFVLLYPLSNYRGRQVVHLVVSAIQKHSIFSFGLDEFRISTNMYKEFH